MNPNTYYPDRTTGEVYRSAVFLSGPTTPLIYSQSPLLKQKNPEEFHTPIRNIANRPNSFGNFIGNPNVTAKALTSLFTKKVDVKAQMKVVRRYKEELKANHEEYIEDIRRYLKELELELREKLLVFDRSKEYLAENLRKIYEKKDILDIDEEKHEKKEYLDNIEDIQVNIEVLEASSPIERHENVKKAGINNEVIEKLHAELKEKDMLIDELQHQISQKTSESSEITKKTFENQKKLSEMEDIVKSLQTELKLKTEENELILLNYTETDSELKKIQQLYEDSDIKCLEKTVAYEELMRDFHALMDEAALKERELKSLNDNYKMKHKQSLTQEEDIIKLKEQLENVMKSASFKKKTKKLSLIEEEDPNKMMKSDSEDLSSGEESEEIINTYDKSEQEIKKDDPNEFNIVKLLKKEFKKQKKELENHANKKEMEIQGLFKEIEENKTKLRDFEEYLKKNNYEYDRIKEENCALERSLREKETVFQRFKEDIEEKIAKLKEEKNILNNQCNVYITQIKEKDIENMLNNQKLQKNFDYIEHLEQELNKSHESIYERTIGLEEKIEEIAKYKENLGKYKENIERLEGENAKNCIELSEKDIFIEEYKKQIISLEETLKNQKDNIERTMDEAEKERIMLTETIKTLRNDIENIKNLMEIQKKCIEENEENQGKLNEIIKEKEEEIRRSLDENKENKLKLREFEDIIKEKTQIIESINGNNDVKQEFMHLENEINEKKTLIGRLQDDNTHLKSLISALENDKKTFSEENDTYISQLKEKDLNIHILTEGNKMSLDENNEIKLKLREFEDIIKEKIQIIESIKGNNDIKQEFMHLENEINEKKTLIGRLQDDNTHLKSLISALENDKKTFSEENDTYISQLKEKDLNIHILTEGNKMSLDENNEIKLKLREFEDIIKEKIQIIESIKGNNDIKQEFMHLENEINEKTTNIFHLQDDNTHLKSLISSLENDKKTLSEENDAYISQLKEKDLIIHILTEENTSLTNEKHENELYEGVNYRVKIQELETNLQELERICSEKIYEEGDYKKAIESYEAEIKELHTEVKELRQREGEYVQYITTVLNEQSQEKEKKIQESQKYVVNEEQMKIKELEENIKKMKENTEIIKNKIKEEYLEEISSLNRKLIDQNSMEKELKKLKETLDKIRKEKEDIEFKENKEISEKTLFIEKLKIELEETKKFKKNDEFITKKQIKKLDKIEKTQENITETSICDEKKEKPTRGAMNKTNKINIEKELLEKEQKFLDELEELKIMLDFVD